MLIFFVCVFVVLVFGMIIERNEQEKELAKTEQVTPTDTLFINDALKYDIGEHTIYTLPDYVVCKDGVRYNLDSLITIYKKYHAK